MKRTDLAHEMASREQVDSGLILEESTINGIQVTRVAINSQSSQRTGKAIGNYVTLFCPKMDIKSEVNVLSHIISKMLPKLENKTTLVAGLGNENITPDSLGVRVAGKVLATAHFRLEAHLEFTDLGLQEVYVIEPGVMAQTGIESAEQLKFIADGIKPNLLIVIDSLACSERQRLAKTIQVTDAGISPGSGVQNQRKEFSSSIFGVPVIAIGVPTVIDLSSLVKNDPFEDNHTTADSPAEENFMVVPRDIDVIITHYAKVISAAINRTLNPALDETEIERLLM